MKISILAIILTLLFSGCETPVYESRVTIEQDGVMYSAYPDEIDESSEDIERLKKRLSYDGYDIDLDIYNFLIVLPIKTKDDLYAEFHKSGQGTPSEYFEVRNCYRSEYGGRHNDAFLITYKYIKGSDNTFYYNLYGTSTLMKGIGLLDHIGDICVEYYNYEVNEFNYINDYTSNEIVIKAQEIKDMLDNLGIYYEDESN